MRFDLYRRADGQLLAVPSVFMPGAFVEDEPELEIAGQVRIPPEAVSNDVLLALGLHGYAELQGSDLELFNAALGASRVQPGAENRSVAKG